MGPLPFTVKCLYFRVISYGDRFLRVVSLRGRVAKAFCVGQRFVAVCYDFRPWQGQDCHVVHSFLIRHGDSHLSTQGQGIDGVMGEDGHLCQGLHLPSAGHVLLALLVTKYRQVDGCLHNFYHARRHAACR